jgi:hypothetical protein
MESNDPVNPIFSEIPPPDAKLWRYLSFAKFASLLHSQKLHFTRVDRLDDHFEGVWPGKKVRARGDPICRRTRAGWVITRRLQHQASKVTWPVACPISKRYSATLDRRWPATLRSRQLFRECLMDSSIARRLYGQHAHALAYVDVEKPNGERNIGSAFHIGEGVRW